MDDTSGWAQHRPRVVAAAAAAVRGVDPEEAASRALVKMLRLADDGVTFEAPLAYWRRAAVNEAYSLAREGARARPVDDDVLAGLVPAAPDVPALEAERRADVDMLRRALDGLTGADRDLLWSRHVDERSVTAIAEGLAVRPHAVTVRLRRAEERLAAGFAAAHAALTEEAECRAARAGMHGYLKGRLGARRRRELEQHVDGCASCTRAFVDVREVSWGLKAIAPWLGAGAALKAAAVVSGTAGAAAASRWGRTTTSVAVAGGVLVVAAGVASAMVLGGGDDPRPPAGTVAVEAAGGVAGGSGTDAAAPGSGATSPATSTAPTPTTTTTTAPSSSPSAPGADVAQPPAGAGAASRGDDAGRSAGSAAAPPAAPAGTPSPRRTPTTAPAADPTTPAADPTTPAADPTTPAADPTTPAPPSSTPTPTAPSTPDPTPTSPGTQTITAELPVHDLAVGLYRVAVSDGATITDVSAPFADTWAYAWARGRWYVQVWRTGSPHVVTVTVTGPAGSTAWLRPA